MEIVFLVKLSYLIVLVVEEEDLYYDLNNKNRYTSKDIELSTLINLKDTIYTLNHNMLKSNIIQ